MFFETIKLEKERSIIFNISAQMEIDSDKSLNNGNETKNVIRMLTIGLKAEDPEITEDKVKTLLDQYWTGSIIDLHEKIYEAHGKAFWGDKWEEKKKEIEEKKKQEADNWNKVSQELLNVIRSAVGDGTSKSEPAV